MMIISNVLLAVGIAAIVPTTGFVVRWAGTPPRVQHWSGWAATATGTVAVFCIALGNLIR